MKKWLKITVTLEDALLESVSDFLIGIIGAGVEVCVDEQKEFKYLNAFIEKENPSESDLQDIIARTKKHLVELSDIFNVTRPELSWEIIEEQDWGQNWKKHFAPFSITESLTIAPSWERYKAAKGENVLIIDPGMAFGTGHHATTALVLELMEQEFYAAGNIHTALDVGTGTGILGMAAALFGMEKVYGIDNDPVAVAAAAKNVKLNRLTDKMAVGGESLSQITEKYSMVLANIVHDVLVLMVTDLKRVTEIQGRLIVSGVIDGEQSRSIISVYREGGFTLKRQKKKGEWVALLFRRDR